MAGSAAGEIADAKAVREVCSSRRWQGIVCAGLPYPSADELLQASAAAFDQLWREDWLEAFASHSAIGAARPGSETDVREQAGMSCADSKLRDALAAANRAYEDRFGFLFLIRATGRSGEEMLTALRDRLDNPLEQEFATACAQEREIVALRLGDLVGATAG